MTETTSETTTSTRQFGRRDYLNAGHMLRGMRRGRNAEQRAIVDSIAVVLGSQFAADSPDFDVDRFTRSAKLRAEIAAEEGRPVLFNAQGTPEKIDRHAEAEARAAEYAALGGDAHAEDDPEDDDPEDDDPEDDDPEDDDEA